MRHRLLIMAFFFGYLAGCGCEPPNADDPARFSKLEQVDVTVQEQVFRAWVARNDADRAAGFMYVDAKLLEPLADGAYPAMLFVFPADQSERHGFWMHNVPVDLDIAFVRSDGTIVTTKTMVREETRNTYPSGPYRFALETKAGVFRKLNIRAGDQLAIPPEALNNVE